MDELRIILGSLGILVAITLMFYGLEKLYYWTKQR